MRTMLHVLAIKGSAIWSIRPEAPVFEALQLMAERDIGALPVMERGRPVGLLSERDYTRKVVLRRRSSHDTPVRLIMSSVVSVSAECSVDACMEIMTSRRTRHVLVMDDEHVRGLVSIGDLVKATIDDQQFTIVQPEQYISS